MNETPPAVAQARTAIDEIDRALLELVARRRALVADLFVAKRELGLPLVDPDREVALLEDRRHHGEKCGIPYKLVDALFCAILADSHSTASE